MSISRIPRLKWLANKYQIEIEEKEQTPEDIALKNEKDKLSFINMPILFS